MALTHNELKELIINEIDEISVLEILQLTVEDLVENFPDKVEDHRAKFLNYLNYSEEEDDY